MRKSTLAMASLEAKVCRSPCHVYVSPSRANADRASWLNAIEPVSVARLVTPNWASDVQAPQQRQAARMIMELTSTMRLRRRKMPLKQSAWRSWKPRNCSGPLRR